MTNFYSQVLIPTHSILAFLLIILFISSIVFSVLHYKSNNLHPRIRKMYLFTFVLSHVQLLFGFVLYFMSPKVSHAGGFMKEAVIRLFTIEHPLMMILGVVLVSIGYIQSKKVALPHKKVFWFYSIALLLVLSRIPYSYLSYLGSGLFN